MTLEIWLAFVAASTALLLIPGPTVLLVLSYALSQGRRVAVSTAAGVALGDFIAMTASVAGLGALVLTSATLFTLLKWAGALYLIYLGIQMLRTAGDNALNIPEAETASAKRTFRHATTVTALNPKSIAFFIAFVPQFVTPDAPLVPQFAILIATFVTLAIINVFAYALLADQVRARLLQPGAITWVARGGGACLIGMGVLTAMLRRSTA